LASEFVRRSAWLTLGHQLHNAVIDLNKDWTLTALIWDHS